MNLSQLRKEKEQIQKRIQSLQEKLTDLESKETEMENSEILKTVRRLADEGQIALASGGDDAFV